MKRKMNNQAWRNIQIGEKLKQNPILFKEVEHILLSKYVSIFEPIGAEPSLLHPFTV